MANVIQIKSGQTAPADGVLKDAELGYSREDDSLYVGKQGDGGLKSVKLTNNGTIYADEPDPQAQTVPVNAESFGGVLYKDFFKKVYPVGAIYMSTSGVSPDDLFGGTWEKIEGRFLLAAGQTGDGQWRGAGTTGGETMHKLTIEEMPSHNHAMQLSGSDLPDKSYIEWHYGGGARTYQGSDLMRAEGGGKYHNNMPPYLAVHIWKRTS